VPSPWSLLVGGLVASLALAACSSIAGLDDITEQDCAPDCTDAAVVGADGTAAEASPEAAPVQDAGPRDSGKTLEAAADDDGSGTPDSSGPRDDDSGMPPVDGSTPIDSGAPDTGVPETGPDSSGSTCNPQSCASGCCDGNTCAKGTTDTQCGKSGLTCVDCTSTNKTCVGSTCRGASVNSSSTCAGCCDTSNLCHVNYSAQYCPTSNGNPLTPGDPCQDCEAEGGIACIQDLFIWACF
jgi:hypothetical protein